MNKRLNRGAFLISFFTGLASFFKKYTKDEQPFETLVGVFVLLLAFFFLGWTLSKADVQTVKGYDVHAVFSSAGDLHVGADVVLKGVKIGSVKDIRLNRSDYRVDITLSLDEDLRLPKDSIVEISTYGLMGDKYVRIKLGKLTEYLSDGDSITAKDFKSLEDLIGQVLFSGAE